jgi:F420-0:gamma-glutamyl ligase-like protein
MRYKAYPIRTHFITVSDNLDDIISKYVLKNAQKNDLIVLCEKIVSIIQNRVVYKRDVRLGFWAKFLSRFAQKTPYGFSVGNPYKMQVAINLAGLPRILLASFLGGIAKLFRIKGVFYRVAGHQISRIDGFYPDAFPQYGEIGILGSKDSDRVCQELKDKFGFSFVIADVNDLGRNIIGKSDDLKGMEGEILEALKDNPAGQSNQQTPIIILRKELNS